MSKKYYYCIHCGRVNPSDEMAREIFCSDCGNSMSLADAKEGNYSDILKNADASTILRLAFPDSINVNQKMIELAAEKGSVLAKILTIPKVLESQDVKEYEKAMAVLNEALKEIQKDTKKHENIIAAAFLNYVFPTILNKVVKDSEDNIINEMKEAKGTFTNIFSGKEMFLEKGQDTYNEAVAISGAVLKEFEAKKTKKIIEKEKEKAAEEAARKAKEEAAKSAYSYSSSSSYGGYSGYSSGYYGSGVPEKYKMTGDSFDDALRKEDAEWDSNISYTELEAIRKEYYDIHGYSSSDTTDYSGCM